MKTLLAAAFLTVMTIPATATSISTQAQILGCHKMSCSTPTKPKPQIKRTVGPSGFCLQNPDGYCRSVQEFWEAKMLRN